MTAPQSPAAARLQAAWLRRGLLACALWPLSVVYGLLRAAHLRLQAPPASPLPVPVLVVGNLIAGGAGKTPTVLALVELLRRQGHVPGVISRGYGRTAEHIVIVTPDTPVSDSGDEPLLMRLRSRAPVAVGRNRVEVARALLAECPEVTVLLSDDGLQHHRLPRDAQVIVFDERGIGNGWLLPAGPLREPFSASRVPSRSVVVYNAPSPSTPWPGHVAQRRLGGLLALSDWWRGDVAQADTFDEAKRRHPRWWAAAGVARPERFFGMLRAAGLPLVHAMQLPDHDDFAVLPWPQDTAEPVVVTEKDAVKLRPGRPGTENVWVATLDFTFPPEFEQALLPLLQRRASR